MDKGSFFLSLMFAFLFCRCFAAAAADDQRSYFCEDIKKPFFAAPPAGKGKFTPQRSQAQPDNFVMPKPDGVKRVFILGESVGVVLGPGASVFAKPAGKAALPHGSPGEEKTARASTGMEIVNCAMPGYESYRIYLLLKEILAYSPDLIIVLSGNREMPEPCDGLDFKPRRAEFRLLELYYSHKYGVLEAAKKASLKIHGEMLAKMAKTAKKAGVPIEFCTLPANIHDIPPNQRLPLENGPFVSGYRSYYAKEYPGALEQFSLAIADEPRNPFFFFYKAKTLEKLGRGKEAAPYFFKAFNLAPYIGHTDRERNDLIKKVALSERACVADLENLFYGISSNGIPGFPEFVDDVHWRLVYNKAVWEQLFRSAGACGIKGFEKFGAANTVHYDGTVRKEALKRLNYALFRLDERSFDEVALAQLSYIREKFPDILEKAAGSQESLSALVIHNLWTAGSEWRVKALFPFFLLHLAETERRAGNYARALALCKKAAALMPAAENPRLELAQILADSGNRRAAEAEFRSLAGNSNARALGLSYGFTVPRHSTE